MSKTRQHITIWLVAGLFTVISLVAHLTSPSSLHQGEENWQTRMTMHRANPAFAVRPFTTSFVDLIHDTFGLSYRTSFFILQFFLMLICGPAFAYYLMALGFSRRLAMAGMVIFYCSLPVFMAHFDPVYTWSDFWVYLMIPLSLLLVLKRAYLPAALSLAWAVLSRETSLIFFPIWFLFIYRIENKRLSKPVLWSSMALAFWIAARLLLSGVAAGNLELKLVFNFDGFLRSRDTIFSLLVALGFLWPIGFRQIFSSKSAEISEYDLIKFGAVFTVCGYCLSALLLAQARETRLFFPPFIFFIPLTLVYFQQRLIGVPSFLNQKLNWKIASAVIAISGLSIYFSFLIFPDFDFRTWQDGNRVMFGLHLSASIILLVFANGRSRNSAAGIKL